MPGSTPWTTLEAAQRDEPIGRGLLAGARELPEPVHQPDCLQRLDIAHRVRHRPQERGGLLRGGIGQDRGRIIALECGVEPELDRGEQSWVHRLRSL